MAIGGHHHGGVFPTGDIFAGVSEAKMKYYFPDEWKRRQSRKKASKKKSGKKK